MNRPEFVPDARPADPARRPRPVLRLSPEAPVLAHAERRGQRHADALERLAAFALVDRALTALSPGVPLSRAARHALYGPAAAQEASRLPSAAADLAPVLGAGALGALVQAADGVTLRLPPWMRRLAPYPGQPDGEACWGGGTFRPWSAGAGRRGQADAGGEPPITTLEVRMVRPAASGAVPGDGPAGAVADGARTGDAFGDDGLADDGCADDAVGAYVEASACTAAAGGRVLRLRACRYRPADYPHADVDEYVVAAAWALGAGGGGPWLAMAGRSYTRAGQDLLLAAVRTLCRA